MLNENINPISLEDQLLSLELEKKEIIKRCIKGLRPLGWRILLSLKIAEDNRAKNEKGEKTCIFLPETEKSRDKYRMLIATVEHIGDMAYKNKNLHGLEPWVKVGDIVFINRYDGNQFMYGGIPFLIINDEALQCIIEDPDLFSTF